MLRTFHVAVREFISTALTRGFIFGVFVLPVMIFFIAIAAKAIIGDGPKLSGTLLIADMTTGQQIAPLIEARFDPAKQEAAAKEKIAKARQMAKDNFAEIGLPEQATAALNNPMAQRALEGAMAGPMIIARRIELGADIEKIKDSLKPSERKSNTNKGQSQAGAQASPVALVVVNDSALKADASGQFGGYELFTIPKLDFQIQGDISSTVSQSVIDARIAGSDLKDQAARIRAMLARPAADVKSMTNEGAKSSAGDISMLLPVAFMLLLWISTFTAGQYLLTTTIEEKSSRVMEVVLSAVSPMQLMVGKILGQMGVASVLMLVYLGAGVGSLAVFSFMHLIDPASIALLLVYFFIAFFLIACMMAAIGSAVTDLREAQSLMTPVMLVMFIPLMLWMPISRNPNGMFATVCSFIPPISPFVMVIRIPAAAGSVPVPVWQIALSIAVGLASVVVACWGAAKIFRIGVLMYGKPPSVGTLIKWIRMA